MIRGKIKCCFVCTAIILSITGCGKTMEQQIAEQLELGQKYFAQQDYEQALVAFNKMIEIDPKQWDAYIGIAEIYEAQEKPDQAVGIMEQGLGVLSVEEVPGEDIDFLVDLYRILADQASQVGDMELTQTYYQNILELRPETEDIQEKQERLEELSQYEQRIRDFVEKVKEENEKEFIDYIASDEELQMWIQGLDAPQFILEEDGTYIGVYPNGGIYIGEIEDGMRQGEGIWVTRTVEVDEWGKSECLDIAKVLWTDDKPNGRMINKYTYSTFPISTIETVNVVNGIYEGVSQKLEWAPYNKYNDGEGELHEFYETYINGQPQSMANPPTDLDISQNAIVTSVCKRCNGYSVYEKEDIAKIDF